MKDYTFANAVRGRVRRMKEWRKIAIDLIVDAMRTTVDWGDGLHPDDRYNADNGMMLCLSYAESAVAAIDAGDYRTADSCLLQSEVEEMKYSPDGLGGAWYCTRRMFKALLRV